jgi:hypothetical protein
MTKARKVSRDSATAGQSQSRHTLRLPRFIVDRPMGAGDAIKRIASTLGVNPCSACEERADRLNRWLTLKPTDDRGGTL